MVDPTASIMAFSFKIAHTISGAVVLDLIQRCDSLAVQHLGNFFDDSVVIPNNTAPFAEFILHLQSYTHDFQELYSLPRQPGNCLWAERCAPLKEREGSC